MSNRDVSKGSHQAATKGCRALLLGTAGSLWGRAGCCESLLYREPGKGDAHLLPLQDKLSSSLSHCKPVDILLESK